MDDVRLQFRWRTKMIDAKMNFKNMYLDTTCSLCQNEEDTIRHHLECRVLMEHCSELFFNDRIVRYEDIFGNLQKQLRAVNLFEKVMKKREELLDKLNI